ncbi:ABC transporter permease [Ligilactobacillus salivarius]|uniref:ABC transporter permease n=1 Tax=Ligilactobacillus salivarius TaxID=1624 RepID=A0A1V9R802_9LACO|nr:ABC transporter permease [Ligilactobacillus salivarius]
MLFGITVIVVYSIFNSIYTSKKEDGHYKSFDEKAIEKNKKISYVVAIVLRISSK